jgi:hypothetical protein
MNLTAASRIGNANSGNAAGDGATALRFKRVGQQQQQLPSQVNGQPRSLEKSGKEYARILYLLETALASHHVKVTHVQVWDVSQPTIVEQFEREVRRCPGVVPLDAWVDVDSLNANNSEENVFRRGFTFPENDEGMLFPTGTLRIAPPPVDGESGLHRFILSQIFTGRAYPKDDPNQKNILPAGYDSLYLFDSQSLEDDHMLDSYSHEYILTRPTQVWPQYVVHFTIAALTEEDRARQGRAKAAHHNQNTDVMGDILELLDRKLHWGQDGVRMKLSGVAALQNELSRAADEYNNSIVASQRRDPTLESVKTQIKEQLSTLNDKLAQVKKNSALVEETVYQILQEALFQLQDETQRKLNMLLGEELELRRRFAHIEWSEARMAKAREEMAPPDFVHAWNHHLESRKRMYAYRDMGASVLNDVHADINVVGGVQIVVENRSQLGAVSGPAGATDLLRLKGDSRGGRGAQMDASSEFRKAVFSNGGDPQRDPYANPEVANSPASHLIASMRRNMEDAGASGFVMNNGSESPHVAGMGLSSSTLQSQDSRSWLRRTQPTGSAANNEAKEPEETQMDNVWMSALREKAGVPAPANEAPPPPVDLGSAPPSRSQPAPARNQASTPRNRGTTSSPGRKSGGRMERFKRQYSLTNESERRSRTFVAQSNGQYGSADELSEALGALMFPNSRILTPEESQKLYFCLPQRLAGESNNCSHLAYASYENEGNVNVSGLMDSMPHPASTAKDSAGCLFIARSGDNVFGAYSHFVLPHDGLYGGSDKNFLFSLTKDMKIPYHGRRTVKKPTAQELKPVFTQLHQLEQEGTEESFPGQFGDTEAEAQEKADAFLADMAKNGWESLFVDENTIRFGSTDLVLSGDLSNCSSQLEQSYGFGMANADARTLLAGGSSFRIQELEVYIVGNPQSHEDDQTYNDGSGGYQPEHFSPGEHNSMGAY